MISAISCIDRFILPLPYSSQINAQIDLWRFLSFEPSFIVIECFMSSVKR